MKFKEIILLVVSSLVALSTQAFEIKKASSVVVVCDTAQMQPVAKTALKMLAGDLQKVLGSEMNVSYKGYGNCHSAECCVHSEQHLLE